MSRRRPPGELQFGSDSFLDVVANIVGILIILIVIAGLRVGRMPVVLTPDKNPASTETDTTPVPSSLPDLADLPESKEEPKETPQVVVVEPVVEAEPELPPPSLPELVAPRELVDRASQLESEVLGMKDEEAKLVKRFQQWGLQQSTMLERQRAIQNLLTEKTKELDASQRLALKAEADMDLLRQTLARLEKHVRDLESTPANVEALEHRITPISRTVDGNEKHYRLEKNRVVEVPVAELVQRFREQLERRKEWLVKTSNYQGEIGPVSGFTMLYRLRVDVMSGLDAARMGHGGYTIRLARWEIRPEPGTKGETEDVAIRKGSQFYQSILGTAPDTTLTFWVYPDSFAIYRKLQKFAHEHGFSVAGRPLPYGLHIAASPDGTKSASE